MLEKLIYETELEIQTKLQEIDKQEQINSKKVLGAFQQEQVSETDFNSTNGYGYNDIGRDKIERIVARIFECEDALVRNQFISGSHALTVTLFALLRPNDTLMSITGKPYDTLDEVIGIKDNPSSLKAFGISYEQIDLKDNTFDTEKIIKALQTKKIKVIEIQRSRGYSTRNTLSIKALEDIIKEIRKVDKNVIIMVDNCYCELVEEKEPTMVGADIIVGSLIKNLGGGIAPNGAYVAGKEKYIKLVAERLTLPGEGKEVGPTLGINRSILQGLFMAPSVVAASLKTACFTACLLEKLGYDVNPTWQEKRSDIVQTITFHQEQDLIKYCQGIQQASPIDSFSLPIPAPMPGYTDKVIMASGSFTQGSSIELSCDGPLRPPYIAYQQGALTFSYGKLGVINACTYLLASKSE